MLSVGTRIATVSDNRVLKTYCLNKNGIITDVPGKKDMEYVINIEGMSTDTIIPKQGIARYVIRVYNPLTSISIEIGDELYNSEILVQYGGNKKTNVIAAWNRMLKKYEGYIYCVKDMSKESIIFSGVFYPKDIDIIKREIV